MIKHRIPYDAHVCALFFAKYRTGHVDISPDTTLTDLLSSLSWLFGLPKSSFKRLRDEYDAFYDNRKGYKDADLRPSRREVFEKYDPYTKEQLAQTVRKIIVDRSLGDRGTNFDSVTVAFDSLNQIASIESEQSNKPPRKVTTTTSQFLRNYMVVASVLTQAKGVCSDCQNPAPFNRKTDGSPYLEVHHLVPLSEGGYDTVANTIALCPNCHAKRHYG